jgi:GNAT superfamily N-acetyltransferase
MALWRVHVELADTPGRLGELATAIGGSGCNIMSLHVVGEPADDGSVTDELLITMPDGGDPAGLVARIEAVGIPCSLLTRADAAELSDPVTTALALARWVVTEPASAPQAVARLLRAQLIDPALARSAAASSIEPHAYVHQLRLGKQPIHLGRAWPFTATELSQAAAMVELATQLRLSINPAASAPTTRDRVLLGDGSEVVLRMATAADAPLVAALHARCSPQSRRSRFLDPSPRLAPQTLSGLLGDPSAGRIAVLALTTDEGSAVGLANLESLGAGLGEFAVLVEDGWHGRGIGTALIRRMVQLGVAAGWVELRLAAQPADIGLTRLLRRSGLRPHAEIIDGVVKIHAELPVPVQLSPR